MQIGQIAVNAHDVDRATAFYSDALGLTLLFRAGPMSFFDCGGVRLMLSRPEKPEFDHPGSVLYFKVDDIDQPHLIARMPDHELWMTFFRDTEGNTLALMCERR
jgi:methylmalonyl-CoA/ethylmalonyl-CoA epimerase